jgi:hypothetical protein
MSKEIGRGKVAQMSKSISSWDALITDAEQMIGEAKDRIARLNQSIEIFRQLRDKGEPFPGQRPKRHRKKPFSDF